MQCGQSLVQQSVSLMQGKRNAILGMNRRKHQFGRPPHPDRVAPGESGDYVPGFYGKEIQRIETDVADGYWGL